MQTPSRSLLDLIIINLIINLDLEATEDLCLTAGWWGGRIYKEEEIAERRG
jgi:hypothetical protein